MIGAGRFRQTRQSVWSAVGALLCASILSGCPEQDANGSSDALTTLEPSPNAAIKPAPLEESDALFFRALDEAAEINDAGGVQEAEAPPLPLREDQPVTGESFDDTEVFGNPLEGLFLWYDMPGPLGHPDLDPGSVASLREGMALKVAVHLTTADRMIVELDSSVFPLGAGSELRVRRDRYGHVLVWAGGRAYRPVPPGALRALIGERRMDVSPLVPGASQPKATGKVLGFATRRSLFTSPYGTLMLEQAEIPGLPRSGTLFCRFLIELAGLEPSTPGCDDRLVPLQAEYRWKGGGKLGFIARKLGRRREYDGSLAATPPRDSDFMPGALPPLVPQLIEREDLRRLRRKEAAVSASTAKGRPPQGLVVRNQTTVFSLALVDGVAVAWLAPNQEQLILGLRNGKYSISFRDFLGQNVIAPSSIEVPGHATAGGRDGPMNDG